MPKNDIYESKKLDKVLTGIVTSIQKVKVEDEEMVCAIVMHEEYRVILPASTLGVREDLKVLRSLIGASIDFTVTGVAESQKIAIASRVKAMETKRNDNKNRNLDGKIIDVNVTGVGRDHLYVEAFGVETTIEKQEVDYGYVNNLRDYAEVGDKVKCKVKSSDILNNKLELSMKELKEDPYEHLEDLFPEDSENLATISNIQDFGVFLTMDQNPKITVLCPIPKWSNFAPSVRDKYIVRVKRLSDNKISGNLIRLVKRSEL